MRKTILVGLVLLGVVCILLVLSRRSGHRLELTVHFADAQGVRSGAPLRLAGVNVGSITGVSVRPDQRQTPVEVRMLLLTVDDLRIPNDSTVSLATAGVLGETYAVIHVESATGPPVQNHGTLKGAVSTDLTSTQLFERFAAALKDRDCGKQTPEQNKNPRGVKKQLTIVIDHGMV
jgi:phospholipid/cholesterol/gamma-HCH transport system substrate-binding protein